MHLQDRDYADRGIDLVLRDGHHHAAAAGECHRRHERPQHEGAGGVHHHKVKAEPKGHSKHRNAALEVRTHQDGD